MDELQDHIFNYVLAPVAAVFAGWFFGRRRSAAEADGVEIENVEKALSIYRGIISDLEAQIKTLKAQIAELETQVSELKNHKKWKE